MMQAHRLIFGSGLAAALGKVLRKGRVDPLDACRRGAQARGDERHVIKDGGRRHRATPGRRTFATPLRPRSAARSTTGVAFADPFSDRPVILLGTQNSLLEKSNTAK
jgi:hypothetical protein